MTRDVLQSDIELAARLKDDQRSDDEIILALTHRGVDPGKAAQLVDDLRQGIKPTPHSAIPPEFTMARRSRSRSVSPGTRPARPSRPSSARSRNGSPLQSTDPRGKRTAVFWRIPAILIAVVAVVGGILVYQRYYAGADATEGPAPKSPGPKVNVAPGAAPAKATVPGQPPSSAALVLALQPDGLHLGDRLVASGNVLTAVANALGAATRTNRVRETDTVIYAYDPQGLLIYCQQGGGTNRIVLDCDASGGDNGTTAPFTGTLMVEDQVISPGTDSQTLAAIKSLGLTRPGASDTVLGGRYNGLGLVFAYLNSPQHLSYIGIDLK